MSTVGYGDLSPNSTGSRVFTLFYIFVGIGLIFPMLASAVSVVISPITASGRAALERLAPQKRIDIDGDGDSDYRVPRHAVIYYGKNLLPSVVLNTILQCIFAAIFCAIEPTWTYFDAFYQCVATKSNTRTRLFPCLL